MGAVDTARERLRAVRHDVRMARLKSIANSPSMPRKPIAIVFGNCQATPLGALLSSSKLFSKEFDVVRVPFVHEINQADTEILRRVLPKTSLYVTQEVRDDYRELPVGTSQLVSLLPQEARTVRFPVLYFEGLYPYQVYLRPASDSSELAPMTDYTDLRYLAFAARGLSDVEAARELAIHAAPAEALRSIRDASIANLYSRESSLDVKMAEEVDRSSHLTASFHTVNHPSNALLAEMSAQIHGILGLDYDRRITPPSKEFLAHNLTPLEASTIEASALHLKSRPDWKIGRHDVTLTDLMALHLAWLRSSPELIATGVEQHKMRLAALNLLG